MQKTYQIYSSALILGQVYDTSTSQLDSYAAEEVIKFGQPVMLGTLIGKASSAVSNTAEQPGINKIISVKALTATGTFLGIAIRSQFQPIGSVLTADNTTDYVENVTTALDQYPIGSNLTIMKLGRVVVNVTQGAANTGLLAYYVPATGVIQGVDTTTNKPANSVAIGTLQWNPGANTTALCVLQVNNLI